MQKDLFKECFDERASATEFKEVFCNRCRNPICTQAGWGKDKFGLRTNTQEARLFNPTFADPNNPKHASLRKRDFPSLFREAVRLERADAIGDWSLPDENVVLAPIESQAATDESQDLVEKAVKSLRNEGSRDQPDQAADEEIALDAPEAQSTGSTDVGFGEDENEDAPHQVENLTAQSKKNEDLRNEVNETLRSTTKETHKKNTSFDDGQMVGGDYPRQQIDEEKTKKQRVLDSWGSDGKVHDPGTTIKMGKK